MTPARRTTGFVTCSYDGARIAVDLAREADRQHQTPKSFELHATQFASGDVAPVVGCKLESAQRQPSCAMPAVP